MEEYQKRVTAFIDIMGFKELIKTSEGNSEKLKSVLNILQYLKAWDNKGPNEWGTKQISVEEDAQRKGIDKFEISNITSCTCFSDSIVVSVLCEDDLLNEKISTIIANLSYIGSKLLQAGVLIRGGITIGKLIHTTDDLVMGPAMIEAYYLESVCAKEARIILSDQLIDLLNYPLK